MSVTSNSDSAVSAALATPEEITKKFKDIIKSNGINDEVSEVIVEDSGLKGENFCSQVKRVTAKFSNPALKTLNLFVKTETSNKSHSEMVEEVRFFEKEILFFTEYIPAIKSFLETKRHEKLLEIYPKCYYADKDLIVFENLVLDREFELLDKVEKQNFEAASMSLTTLAKHHALSYAYIKELGGIDELLKKFPTMGFESFAHARTMFDDPIEDSIKTNIRILSNSSAKGKEETIAALKAKQGIVWSFIMDVLKVDMNDPLNLLNHGDYWNNNMLFKRDKETNKFVDHIAIDLQAIRIDSPGADLGYFMYSSVQHAVRQTRLKELLTIYLDTLNETTAKLGHPIQLSYDNLFQNFRKRFEFGFWIFGIMVATKACYSVLKDLDISEQANLDMNEMNAVYNQLVEKWIEANPEQCQLDAQEMIKLFDEYKSLSMK